MTSGKLKSLANALLRETEQGKVHWETTPSEGVFRAWIGEGGVKIGEFFEPSDEEHVPGYTYYRLWVLNAKDEIVDEFEDKDELERLFRVARRNAKGADEVVDSILQALEKAK